MLCSVYATQYHVVLKLKELNYKSLRGQDIRINYKRIKNMFMTLNEGLTHSVRNGQWQ